MKQVSTIIIILFFSVANAQITLINTGTSSQLTPLSVINKNVVVYGIENYISKSYNECNSLSPLIVPGQMGNWNSYQRLDTTLCFVSSVDFNTYDLKIFRSITDGQSWVTVLDSTGGANLFTHFAFFDSNEGILAGTFNQFARTKNGGTTWIQGTQPLIALTAIEAFGDSMLILGGVQSGTGVFVVSKDRGNSWINIGSSGYFDIWASPKDFYFLNKDTIFGVADMGQSAGTYSANASNFVKSFNRGKNWTHSAMPLENPYGVYFKNATEGYAVGRSGTNSGTGIILKTTDLGQTWWKYDTQINEILEDIRLLNDSIALVSGTNGLLFKFNIKTAVFISIGTGIDEIALDNLALSIFPNPVTDKLNFQFDNTGLGNLKLTISNTLGQTVYSKENVDLKKELDVNFLKSGIYYLKLYDQKTQKTFKIAKD